MEKKRISNFAILLIAIVIAGVMVISKTVMAIKEKHEERLIYSMHTKVEYIAERCYLEEKCSGDTTLMTLFDQGYLKEDIVDPITKELVDRRLEVKYVDGKVVINW